MLSGFAALLVSCGGDSTTNSQSKEPLRLNVRMDPAFVDEPYSTTFTAEGGVRPYKFILEGNLPQGLTYSGGRISGTPKEKGSFDLNLTVEDANISSRVQKLTLAVGETPPPSLEQQVPLSEQEGPFTYALRVRTREAKGFQAQIQLKDLKPVLDSLKAADNLLYVSRYNEETRLLDIDAVFVTPRKDVEMVRLTLTPDKAVRPQIAPKVAFYDKNGKLVSGNPEINRAGSEGKYKFSDLEAIARNWGRKAAATAPAAQAPATPEAKPAEASPAPTKSAETTPATQPATEAKPETPADKPAEAAPATPDNKPAEAAQPAQAEPAKPEATPPAEGQKPPTDAQAAQPAQPAAQPEQKPATNPPAQAPATPAAQPPATPQKLEGDLNGDGSVDAKDLDLLRSSYAWASVAGVKSETPPPPPSTPAGGEGGTPNQPNQPNPPAKP